MKELVKLEMERVIELKVLIKVEADVGPNWLGAH